MERTEIQIVALTRSEYNHKQRSNVIILSLLTIESVNVGTVKGDDEWRGGGSTSTEQAGLVKRKEKANNCERGDINDSLNEMWSMTAQLQKLQLKWTLTMRQKVPFTAAGMVSRGFGVSLAARPTSSVPARFEYDKPIYKQVYRTGTHRRKRLP